MVRRAFTLIAVWSALFTNSAFAATFAVDRTDDTAAAQACTAAANDCSLRGAVMKANSIIGNDTISVPAGTYNITIPGSSEDANLTGDFDAFDPNGLFIQGAGAGSTIIHGSSLDRIFHAVAGNFIIRDVEMRGGMVTGSGGAVSGNETVRIWSSKISAVIAGGCGGAVYAGIDAFISNSIISGAIANGSGGAVCAQNIGYISGSTISNNLATTDGGGVWANNKANVSTNSIISGNIAAKGGGVWANSGRIVNSTITGNLASADGGGLYISGDATITNTIIDSNRAANRAGGLFITGTATITDTTISGNKAIASAGGGIMATSLTITDSAISGNSADSSGGVWANTATVTGSTISNNTSASWGGGLYSSGASTITGSTFSGNSASTWGGGLLAAGTSAITNSTFSGNSGSDGGGVHAQNPATITNTTISGNTATNGGGLYTNGAGNVQLVNTIIANSSGGECAGAGNFTSLGNNIASDATCNLIAAGDLPNTNPALGPLANNGGPTMTHALLYGGPAIDAGTNGSCPATDQRGDARPQPATGVCDIGSFELFQYGVNVTVAGSGAVTSWPGFINCTGVCVGGFLPGTAVGLTATPDPGFQFTGWSGDCTGTGACNLTMNGDHNVTATFTVLPPNQYQLSLSIIGSGSVTSAPGTIDCPNVNCTDLFVDGTSVALTATPSAGRTFLGWSGACAGTGACNVTMTANTNVVASFDNPPGPPPPPIPTPFNPGGGSNDATLPGSGGPDPAMLISPDDGAVIEGTTVKFVWMDGENGNGNRPGYRISLTNEMESSQIVPGCGPYCS